MQEASLVGGPQDGARVTSVKELPFSIYVGRTPLGDGYAAWSSDGSQVFPACYIYASEQRFVFNGWNQ
jgi:hypothetical protein